jgi:hypothetical protein
MCFFERHDGSTVVFLSFVDEQALHRHCEPKQVTVASWHVQWRLLNTVMEAAVQAAAASTHPSSVDALLLAHNQTAEESNKHTVQFLHLLAAVLRVPVSGGGSGRSSTATLTVYDSLPGCGVEAMLKRLHSAFTNWVHGSAWAEVIGVTSVDLCYEPLKQQHNNCLCGFYAIDNLVHLARGMPVPEADRSREFSHVYEGAMDAAATWLHNRQS